MQQFSVTLGVVPGYGHDNGKLAHHQGERLRFVTDAWIAAMEAERAATGITVGAVLVPSVTVYPTEFGCPVGGELTVTITGTMHPFTTGDVAEWRWAVERIVEAVRKHFQQSTALITFSAAGTVYLRDCEPSPKT